jgi:hypothetical protein
MINNKYIQRLLSIIFVCLSWHIYASEIPEEKAEEVKVLFKDERKKVPIGPLPVLSIDTSRFPFFSGFGTWEQKGQKIAVEHIEYASIKLTQEIDQIIQINKTIETDFKRGIYNNIPPAISDIFSRYKISFATFPKIINDLTYIHKPDLAEIVGYQYAKELTQHPIENQDIEDLKFESSVDASLAKIIIDHALIKKARYVINPINLTAYPLAMYKIYKTSTDGYAYLCPTVSEEYSTFVFVSANEYKSRRLACIKNEKGEYIVNAINTAFWPGGTKANYKIPSCDMSYDFTKKIEVMIISPAQSQLNIMDIENYLTPSATQLGTEIDAQGTKLIFEPQQHTFFFKFKGNIYKGDADNKTIDLNTPIDIAAIQDPWIKKFLSDDDAMAHSCPAVSYADAQKEPFFNTRCLHAIEFEAVQQKKLKEQLGSIYKTPVREIMQCACDPNHDTHYYLTHLTQQVQK